MPDSSPSIPNAPLSETELAVLELVATGATNVEIARQRTISETTVKKHLSNINAKLETTNRTEAVRRAIELGLVSLPSPQWVQDDAAEEHFHGATHALSEALKQAERRLRRWRRYAVLSVLFAMAIVLVVIASADGQRVFPLGATPTRPSPTALPTPAPSWEPSERLPLAIAGGAAASVDSRVALVGGVSAGRVLSSTWWLDLAQVGRWQPRAGKPTPVQAAGAATVQGRIIVPGGCGQDGRALAVTEVYDPRRDAWERLADMPAPRCGYGLASLEGQVFVFGGRLGTDHATATDTVFRYDVGADRWTEIGRLPFARSDLGAATYRGVVHLIGGWSAEGERQVGHWLFRPFDAPTWDTDHAPPLPVGRAGFVMAAVKQPNLVDYDNLLVVVGGAAADPQDAISLALDGADIAWQRFPPLPGFTPQDGAVLATAVTYKDFSTLLIMGGRTSSGRELDESYTYLRRWQLYPFIAPVR